MIDVVFDTNTFLQAAAAINGPAHACWRFAEERQVRVFVTEVILREIEDVLTRPKVRERLRILTDEHVADILNAFRAYCSLVAEPPATFQLPRDQDDAKFIDLAIAVGARYIVTRDRDLLDLDGDLGFSTRFPGLEIITPVGFLEVVRAS